jgi:cell division protein FtsB
VRRLRRAGIDAAALAKLGRFARIGSRAVLLTTVACILGLVAVQFVGIVAKNVSVARELATSRNEIEALQAREADQRHTIVRLSDPRGAVPEIHDKLHVVGKREELIYVRGNAEPTAGPDDWRPQP